MSSTITQPTQGLGDACPKARDAKSIACFINDLSASLHSTLSSIELYTNVNIINNNKHNKQHQEKQIGDQA